MTSSVSDGGGGTVTVVIDETYEFSAPRFFDFIKGESDEETREAELWFDTALTYAPSPFMPRIKASNRSFKVESLCDFTEADQVQKVTESSDLAVKNPVSDSQSIGVTPPSGTVEKEIASEGVRLNEESKPDNSITSQISDPKDARVEDKTDAEQLKGNERSSPYEKDELPNGKEKCKPEPYRTPKPTVSSQKGGLTSSSRNQLAKRSSNVAGNPSLVKKSLSRPTQKGIKAESVKRDTSIKIIAGTSDLAQENQAIKRQKLEEGKSRQILNVKGPQPLPHKSKLGMSTANSNITPSATTKVQERKIYVREKQAPAPFVSMAEMMKKFNSSTRDLNLPNVNSSLTHGKPKLTLTRPKEPELETSQRVRHIKVKSTAELEEEMMEKIPKFKARPLNKKIFQGPTLPPLPRSTPQPPNFQEFHFETTARANQTEETASIASTEVSHQNNPWRPHLTEPKTPILHTSMRARPTRVKSSSELENELLEKIPQFKARPLNKKIFESKGELGIFCNPKKQMTVPQEFHFATNERIPPPVAVADLFDKLSLNSETSHNHVIPKNTTPNPFHLHTEERGAEKERKFVMDVVQKQIQEEKARIPKANPYPYTTDYPVVPPKPEPKASTEPEPFQLTSLERHEEEMQREMEERRRMEEEEARMRIFKAQPILKEDPIPVPEKVRKPLTQVQEFNLQADQRAIDRAEFDQKVKEKERLCKRYREENEAARMVEEEKAVKQLRRTLVHHALPLPAFDHPFCPQKSSKEPTKAKSPNLLVIQRKERRKMLMKSAMSSPATNMR